MMAYSPNRTKAAVIQFSSVIIVDTESNLESGGKRYRLDAYYPQLALHPDCRWLATRTANANVIQLWELSDATSGPRKASVPGSKYFTFSPDGNWFATSWAGEFQFYRVGAWDQPALRFPRRPVSDQHAPLTFARDGRTVALASSRYTIRLVRLPASSAAELETLATLESPDRLPLEMLAFSADGRRLAAATDRQVVQLWNLAALRHGLAELDLHQHWPEYPPTPE
jgi:WD40 repeat protein